MHFQNLKVLHSVILYRYRTSFSRNKRCLILANIKHNEMRTREIL